MNNSMCLRFCRRFHFSSRRLQKSESISAETEKIERILSQVDRIQLDCENNNAHSTQTTNSASTPSTSASVTPAGNGSTSVRPSGTTASREKERGSQGDQLVKIKAQRNRSSRSITATGSRLVECGGGIN